MRDPFFRPLTSVSSSRDSLFHRIRENFQQVFAPVRIFPSSANGAPLHLPRWDSPAQSNRAHSASLLTHAAVIASPVLAAAHPPSSNPKRPTSGEVAGGILRTPKDLLEQLRGLHPSGGTGNGSGHDLLPPTQGNLPARSSLQFLKPTLPRNQNPQLPVPPTILDASAPRVLPPVINIGIPWMQERNDSSGPANGNTIGTGPNDSIGTMYCGSGPLSARRHAANLPVLPRSAVHRRSSPGEAARNGHAARPGRRRWPRLANPNHAGNRPGPR